MRAGPPWHPILDALRYLIGLGIVVYVFVADLGLDVWRVVILLSMIVGVDVVPESVWRLLLRRRGKDQ